MNQGLCMRKEETFGAWCHMLGVSTFCIQNLIRKQALGG